MPYWNAYVAATQMHGSGMFFDQRFADKDRYLVAAKSGAAKSASAGNTRGASDSITSKLAALHLSRRPLRHAQGRLAREP